MYLNVNAKRKTYSRRKSFENWLHFIFNWRPDYIIRIVISNESIRKIIYQVKIAEEKSDRPYGVLVLSQI